MMGIRLWALLIFTTNAVCGQGLLLATEQKEDRLLLIDAAANRIVWEWKPVADPMIPAGRRKWFALPSDAKGSADGKTLYFSCSGGAIGAVDVHSRRLLWYTWSGGNPHSIEALPEGYVATASSNGSFVKVFATAGKKGFIDSAAADREPLLTAHSVVWDGKVLWSAGYREMVGWSFDSGRLHVVCRRPLPDIDGHDLAVYGDHSLVLSTSGGLWIFDTRSRVFSAYEDCVPRKGIKSWSRLAGRVILVYPNESWWSDRVYNCDGSVFFRLEGARFYKVRAFSAGYHG